MNGILIVCVLAVFTHSQWSSASVLNRTDQYSAPLVPVEELESIRAGRQQNTGTGTSGTGSSGSGGSGSSSSSIGTGAAVTGLLATIFNGINPLVHNVLFGLPTPPPNRRSEAEQANTSTEPAATAPPPNIRVVIEYDGDKPLNSTVVDNPPPPPPTTTTTTTPPIPTTNQPETPNFSNTIVLRYRVKPRPRTTPIPTTESPEPLGTITRTQPGQVLVYLRQPNDSLVDYSQTFHLFPESSKINSYHPDSSLSAIKNFGSINAHLPENAMAEIKNIIENRYSELLKVVGEAGLERAPVPTTQKPYIFLALPLDEYEAFIKYRNRNRI